MKGFPLPPHGLLFSISSKERKGKEVFYLSTHSTHFIYSYMASDIWLRTTQNEKIPTATKNTLFN